MSTKKPPELEEFDYESELEKIQSTFQKRVFKRFKPVESEVPQLFVTLPDELETVQIAPLYDVHYGSREQDEALLDRHLEWIADTPNVFTFNGGDAFENITPHDGKMGYTQLTPDEQILKATEKFGRIAHKMMFSIPGNHEDRSFKNAGISSAKMLAENLKTVYFSDYCFCTIKWRGNSFRICAHHGSGGAQTPGAQRNAARKELTWCKPDILWTGHLHQPMLDAILTYDVDQKTGKIFERNVLAIISPSYINYFGGYAAKKRLSPGLRGLTSVTLMENGQMYANIHAKGRRL